MELELAKKVTFITSQELEDLYPDKTPKQREDLITRKYKILEKKRRFVYYDCTAARPSNEANTIEESKTPQTDTITITMSARSTDKAIKAVIEPTAENEAIYNTFFEQVYEKNAQPESV